MTDIRKVLPLAVLFSCSWLVVDSVQGQQEGSGLQPIQIVSEVPGYYCNWPVSIAADSGLIFIADYADCCINVLDEDLTWIRTIGGPGDGPGEFRYIFDIDARNGVLAVLNRRPAYISLFDYEGNLLDRWNISASIRFVWGDIRLTDRNSLYLACHDSSPETFIRELSLTGELIEHHLSDPVPHPMERASEARLVMHDDQVYVCIINAPRMIGFGSTEFDWTFDYKGLDPMITCLIGSWDIARRVV